MMMSSLLSLWKSVSDGTFSNRRDKNGERMWRRTKLEFSFHPQTIALSKMASIWLVTITFIWVTTSIGAESLRDCHTTDPKPYIYYATRTPYELINNEDSSPIFAAGTAPICLSSLSQISPKISRHNLAWLEKINDRPWLCSRHS